MCFDPFYTVSKFNFVKVSFSSFFFFLVISCSIDAVVIRLAPTIKNSFFVEIKSESYPNKIKKSTKLWIIKLNLVSTHTHIHLSIICKIMHHYCYSIIARLVVIDQRLHSSCLSSRPALVLIFKHYLKLTWLGKDHQKFIFLYKKSN